MGWLLAVLVFCLICWAWVSGRLIGALLMFPVLGWLFWLAFLPPEPSSGQWIVDAAVSGLIAALPRYWPHLRAALGGDSAAGRWDGEATFHEPHVDEPHEPQRRLTGRF